MDDASCFLVIRLGPKTSECEKNVTVVSTVTGCDVTNCATTLHGFNKHVQHASVCTFKTSPCLPATRTHVSQHVRVVPVHTEPF